MDVFLARQPIFDRTRQVFAYELLFRRSNLNYFEAAYDQEQASAEVLSNGFFSMDILQVTSGKRAFVNFTDKLLLSGLAHLLPKEYLTVEILETVEPTAAVVGACKKLKAEGYQIALDDFVFAEKFQPLIELADIIKVDFLNTSSQQRDSLFFHQVPPHIKMLAEKVETLEMFQEAMALGCDYFQGYFFSKPLIVKGRDISHSQVARLQVLQEIRKSEMDWCTLEEIFKREVGLSYKLLKYINSPVFGLRGRVSSISHAMKLLGQEEMAKWLTLMLLRSVGENTLDEVMSSALIRARFGELLAQKLALSVAPPTVFLTGMFSLLDVFLGISMADVLKEIPVGAEIAGVLSGAPGSATDLHRLILAYEKSDWLTVVALAAMFGVKASDVAKTYGEALDWFNRFSAVHD